MARGLTPRQEHWYQLYMFGPREVRYNATRAAIAAGYSARSAHNQGSRNSRNPVIRARIEAHFTALVAAWRR